MDNEPQAPAQSQAIPPTVAADPSAQNSWAAAAQPAGSVLNWMDPSDNAMPQNKWDEAAKASKGTGDDSMQPQQINSTGTVAPVAMPAELPPETRVMTPLQRGGLFGFMDKVADLMTGGYTKPELAKDQDGNVYVKQHTLTGGEKWARVAAEALQGAAAGLAAGRGRNFGAAAEAGVQAGQKQNEADQKQQQDMSAEARQQTLDAANRQMLRMKMAEQAWDFTHHQIEANQADIKFANEQLDRLTDPKHGGVVVGVAAHPGDIGDILHVQPDIMEQLVKEGTVETVPHYDADGKAAGVSVVLMPKDYKTQIAPQGTPFPTFNKVTGEYDWHKASDATPWGRIDDYWTAAGADRLEFDNKKAVAAKTQAETTNQNSEAAARDKELPSKIAENEARTKEANAQANKVWEEVQQLKTPSVNDPAIARLGELAAQGGLTEDMLSGFGKGKNGKAVREAVQEYLAEHHPNLAQGSIFITGAERKQKDLANNALENTKQLSTLIAQNPQLLGIWAGRETGAKVALGTNSEAIAAIDQYLDNYALATTGAHGVKAVQARADARKDLLNAYHNGPQAVQAAIAASQHSLQNLASVGTPRGLDGSPYIYNRQPQPAAQPQASQGQLPNGVKPGEQFSTGPKGIVVLRNNQWVDPVTGKAPQ